MTYKIETIEGIGKVYGDKLREAGLKDTAALLAACAGPKDRAALAAKTGIPDARVLEFANRADLMRVKGIGEEYSDLLEAAGVDTVKELKTRRADNLTAKMTEINAAKKLVRQLPSEKQVADWIEHAKTLPAVLTY